MECGRLRRPIHSFAEQPAANGDERPGDLGDAGSAEHAAAPSPGHPEAAEVDEWDLPASAFRPDPRSGGDASGVVPRVSAPTGAGSPARPPTGVCTNPTCTVPARRCDLDQVIQFPDGHTAAGNLDEKCRSDHRAKTHAGHRSGRTGPHSGSWTTPTGHTYVSDVLPLEEFPADPPESTGACRVRLVPADRARSRSVPWQGLMPARSGSERNCPAGSYRHRAGFRRTPGSSLPWWGARRRIRSPAGLDRS